jgi:hypothetical protein
VRSIGQRGLSNCSIDVQVEEARSVRCKLLGELLTREIICRLR